jgi:hypothetical protein
MNYVLNNDKVLRFHTETVSCKTSTNSTVDGCSAQAQVSQCHNSFCTLLWFSLVRSFTLKGMYLHGARSGYEPELPFHFRTLPEMPVTYSPE